MLNRSCVLCFLPCLGRLVTPLVTHTAARLCRDYLKLYSVTVLSAILITGYNVFLFSTISDWNFSLSQLDPFSFLGAWRRISSLSLKNENLASILLCFVNSELVFFSPFCAHVRTKCRLDWTWFSGSSEWLLYSLHHCVQGCHWRQYYHAILWL